MNETDFLSSPNIASPPVVTEQAISFGHKFMAHLFVAMPFLLLFLVVIFILGCIRISMGSWHTAGRATILRGVGFTNLMVVIGVFLTLAIFSCIIYFNQDANQWVVSFLNDKGWITNGRHWAKIDFFPINTANDALNQPIYLGLMLAILLGSYLGSVLGNYFSTMTKDGARNFNPFLYLRLW